MSVVIGPVGAAGMSWPNCALICAAIAAALAPPSFSAGISVSTYSRTLPSSLATCRVARHLGNELPPRNGPRLLSRRIIALPHFSQGTVVAIFVFGGCGLPSLSRLMIVSQAFFPASSFTEYPVQPRNSPKRPRRLIISRPQLGQRTSLFSMSLGLPCSSTGLVLPHSRFSQARKNPFLLMRYSSGLPHFSHV